MSAPGWSNFSRGMQSQGPFSELASGHVSGASVRAATQGRPLMGLGGLGWRRLEPLACAMQRSAAEASTLSSAGFVSVALAFLVPAGADALLDDMPGPRGCPHLAALLRCSLTTAGVPDRLASRCMSGLPRRCDEPGM